MSNFAGYFARMAGFALAATAVLMQPCPAGAADMTVRQVVQVLVRASPDRPADLSRRDLSRLDLSGLDFKHANLAGTNMFGTDLTDSNLSGSNLSGAVLSRAIIIRANFDGADLSSSTVFLPATSSFYDHNPAAEAPHFARANFSHARVFGHFANGDWRGANLSGAHFERGGTQFLIDERSDLSSCVLAGANLQDAVLSGVVLEFANLRGADLSRSDLRNADLAGAYLDGAKLDGANLSGADLSRTDLHGSIGLERAQGLAAARNLDRAER